MSVSGKPLAPLQERGRERGQGSSLLRPEALTHFARAFIVAVVVWLLILGVFNLRHPSDWSMGDWLINYAGGFVRRGLTGEFALLLRDLHVPLLWTILLLQWLLYSVVLLRVWRLTTHLRWAWWQAALFFSPATLAFVLLDPPFAYRKDVLFFALLSLTFASEEASGPARGLAVPGRSLLLALACAVCIFAHEGLIVFFPYLFAGVYLQCRDLRRTAQVFALPAFVSLLLFAVVSRFPGNARIAQAVCTSIGGTLTSPPSGICGGAIDYLTHNSAYAHREVVRVLLTGNAKTHIAWLFVLPLLPVVLGLVQFWQTDRQAARVLLSTALVAFVLSFAVFYYGTDWTRWIYIHVFSLMLVMLYAAQREQIPSGLPASTLFASSGSRRVLAWAGLLIYCLGWELTVYGQRPLYGGFARFVTHNLARGQQ